MTINIIIVFLTAGAFVSSYFLYSLSATDMHWEKKWKNTNWLSWISPMMFSIDAFLLANKSETQQFFFSFFNGDWKLMFVTYVIVSLMIQVMFGIWGKYKMTKFYEAKEQLRISNIR